MTCDVASRSSAANDDVAPTNGSENGKYRIDSTTAATIVLLCKRYYDVAIVCVVILVVWALFALPTIFYNWPMKPESHVRNSSDCSPEIYNGSICREALQTRQSCLLDRNTSGDIFIAVDPASSQSFREEQASFFIQGFLLLAPGPECMKAVVPFLCFYVFPLCDSNSRFLQPSSEECREITDNVCAQEFQTAAMFATADQLPQCQQLPITTLECNATEVIVTQLEDTMAEVNSSAGRECSEGFYINETTGLCMPECGVWEEFSHSTVAGVDTVVILSAIVYLLTGLAVLVLSCINYKRMFSFPSVFVVYGVIAAGVMEVFRLIGYTDRTSLFCSSRDLVQSALNETRFCTLQGLVFSYAALVYAMFWVFYTVILFWRIVFPFHAKKYETRGYFRYIHIAMVIAAIVLPLESVGVILGTGGLTITRFPPVACFARETDASYFAYVLPVSIISAIGVSLLVIILWARVGNSKTHSKNDGIGPMKVKRVSTPELKILIVLLYYSIIYVTSLTGYTITLRGVTEFKSDLAHYFVCESQGIQPGMTCERGFNRISDQIFEVVLYSLLGFLPVVSLIYVINYQEMKQKCVKWTADKSESEGSETLGTAYIAYKP